MIVRSGDITAEATPAELVIRRHGAAYLLKQAWGKKPPADFDIQSEKRIPYASITAAELRQPGMTAGYLRFTVAGEQPGRLGLAHGVPSNSIGIDLPHELPVFKRLQEIVLARAAAARGEEGARECAEALAAAPEPETSLPPLTPSQERNVQLIAAGVVLLLLGGMAWWLQAGRPGSYSGGISAAARPETSTGSSTVEYEAKPFKRTWLKTDASSVAFGGRRARLAVGCGGTGPSLFFDLAQPAPSPPPLRGVYATLQVDDEKPVRLEMAWATDSDWTPRTEHPTQDGGLPKAEVKRIALAIAEARSVRMEGLDGYGPTPVEWTVNLSKGERLRFTNACRKTGSARSRSG